MEHLVLENDVLHVVVDVATGAMRALAHRTARLSLLSDVDQAASSPFLVVFADGSVTRRWTACVVSRMLDDARAISIRWTIDDGLTLEASVRLGEVGGDLQCRCMLLNPHGLPVAAVAYPYLAGIGRLGEVPTADELVHPYATGFLVRNPLDHLPPVQSEVRGKEPLALGLYPEGFSGSTMSFMAYSAAGRGGFYIAAEDGDGREKWLNFYRHADGDLRLAVWHGCSDPGAQHEIITAYPTVIAALNGGSWYDAADRYKAWAVQQSWLAQGPLWMRNDRCRWLFEQVGLCTFGINPRHDRARWIDTVHEIAGTPVVHMLGPSWAKAEADYMNHLPGGLEDWFPARFDLATIEAIRRHGDYLVPFEFDLLFGLEADKADHDQGISALQVFPDPPLSRDNYAKFPYLCPATTFCHDLHVVRDQTLVRDWHVDGVYYDISMNNVRHICLAATHGHPPGATSAITAAYRAMLRDSAHAMRTAADGRSIPQGTELVNEQMIPVVAFYQARAEASPAAPFDAAPFRSMIKAGAAEKIPLFAYVYHEYGPLRLDGWAKLSREQGDYVYFVLGRTLLQGGLIELNYEFSALEELDGVRDVPEEHYYRFAEHHYPIDPALAQYVGTLARARVGPANKYLAYGTMLRPAPMEVVGEQTLTLEYFLYHVGTDFPEYEDRSSMQVPVVLQSAWRYREDSAAWLLLNLDSQVRLVDLALDQASMWRDRSIACRLTLHGESNRSWDMGMLAGPRRIRLRLPSRQPMMIEATPVAAGDGSRGTPEPGVAR